MSERKTRWKPGSDFMSSAAAIWMVPLLALFLDAQAPSAWAIPFSIGAALAGAFVERWLFFAQARHMVTLYY